MGIWVYRFILFPRLHWHLGIIGCWTWTSYQSNPRRGSIPGFFFGLFYLAVSIQVNWRSIDIPRLGWAYICYPQLTRPNLHYESRAFLFYMIGGQVEWAIKNPDLIELQMNHVQKIWETGTPNLTTECLFLNSAADQKILPWGWYVNFLMKF